MVKRYSHSKLWLYENCPEAYKVKYIDKMFPDLPLSIELFLGDYVHQSLEWLYEQVIDGVVPELDDLIKHFAENWQNNYSFGLRIRKGNGEDYFNKGIKFLVDYYGNHKPFEEKTIDVEKKITFPLDDKGEYEIVGYIDRIVLGEDGTYEIHDYKTSKYMKSQEEADKDRQLAFYHLGLKNIFGQDARAKLIWHFLAFNHAVSSKRDDSQLENLKKETLALIKKIETTTEWPSCGKPWCDWCAYKKSLEKNSDGSGDSSNESSGNGKPNVKIGETSFGNKKLNKYFID